MPERQDSLWIDDIKEAIARVEEYTVGISYVVKNKLPQLKVQLESAS